MLPAVVPPLALLVAGLLPLCVIAALPVSPVLLPVLPVPVPVPVPVVVLLRWLLLPSMP